MTTILRITMLLGGISLAAWLALVAHDLGNGFARFRRFARSSQEV